MANSDMSVEINSEFLRRLGNNPTVSSAFALGSSQLERFRECSPLFNRACGAFGRTASYVVGKTAQNLPQNVRSGLAGLDNLGCFALNKVEEAVPIVKSPPEKIYADSTALVQSKLASVSRTIDPNWAMQWLAEKKLTPNQLVSLPAKKADEYWNEFFKAVDAILNTAENVLDNHMAAIGKQEVSARKIERLEFKEHLDEIASKVRICLGHHTGEGVASVKKLATAPKEHLVATLQKISEVRQGLMEGKSVQEVLQVLYKSWLNGVIAGDASGESVARLVLTMFHNAVTKATASVEKVAQRVTGFLAYPHLAGGVFLKVVSEQFNLYSSRLYDMLQQVSGVSDWMPKVFPDIRNGSVESTLNRTASSESSSDESARESSDS